MKKIDHFLLFNFLTWSTVINYTGNASKPMKLIGDVLNLIT